VNGHNFTISRESDYITHSLVGIALQFG